MDYSADVLDCASLKLRNNTHINYLPRCEKWIASSALQKCVRRSEAELAQRAAFTFAHLDPAGLWRRLISIAFEDVGAGDIDVLIETVAIATSPDWRANAGEEKVLAYVVQRLTGAPKDRSADYLMLAARLHATFEQMRQTCKAGSIETRPKLVADLAKPLGERAVAA
jgi:replication-associated recombination protein RarA